MCDNESKMNIEFYQGIVLTIALFSIFQLLHVIADSPLQLIFPLYEKLGCITYEFGRQLYIDTQALVLYVFRLAIIYLIIQKFAGISIKTWLFHNRPSLTQSLYWAFIGVCLALFSSVSAWRENIENPFYIVWISTAIGIILNLIAPLQEEIVHRGILFSALQKKGRLPAYFISIIWFVFGHVPSYSNLFFDGLLGIELSHFILLVLMAIFTAYIYETTKKLSLCIIFHSACNLTTVISAFLNYYLERV